MRRGRGAIVVVALLAGACDRGPPIPPDDVLLRITAGADVVESGKAFPLTVVRVWEKDLTPAPWSDRSLAPLVVRLIDAARREDDGHVEETRRYRGYAFGPGDVTVAAVPFTATPRDGGPARTATSDTITIRVRPALDPSAPGPAELPGGLLVPPSPWQRWALIGAAVSGAAVFLVGRRRRERARRGALAASATAPAAVPDPRPAPHERALRRIEELRARRPRIPAEIESWYVDASSLVREYVAERFAIPTAQRTSEELVASPPAVKALPGPQRTLLADLLLRCDFVKFARHAPDDADRERLLASAETFVTQTRAAASPTPDGPA
jgi:hypothetical protein